MYRSVRLRGGTPSSGWSSDSDEEPPTVPRPNFDDGPIHWPAGVQRGPEQLGRKEILLWHNVCVDLQITCKWMNTHGLDMICRSFILSHEDITFASLYKFIMQMASRVSNLRLSRTAQAHSEGEYGDLAEHAFKRHEQPSEFYRTTNSNVIKHSYTLTLPSVRIQNQVSPDKYGWECLSSQMARRHVDATLIICINRKTRLQTVRG